MKLLKNILLFALMTTASWSVDITDGCDLPGGTLYLSDDNDGSVLYNSPAGCTYYDEQNQFVISYDQDECSAQANPELFDGIIGGFQFTVDDATVNG